MTDQQFVEFLQWALPRLELRWPGFRKVRRQVRKRVGRRLGELGLEDLSDYRAYLESHPGEWPVLDRLCRISLSRFYRDRGVFDRLRDEVLPTLARLAAARDRKQVRCWSVGCASGEEVYTLAILWKTCVSPRYPGISLRQTATDADEQMLQRARRASYAPGSLKDVPPDWLDKAFARHAEEYVLRAEFRAGIEFLQHDIRGGAGGCHPHIPTTAQQPDGPFHLVLCRNLVFTYFAESLQRKILGQITRRMLPGSFLVIGKQEALPEGVEGFAPCGSRIGIYRIAETGGA